MRAVLAAEEAADAVPQGYTPAAAVTALTWEGMALGSALACGGYLGLASAFLGLTQCYSPSKEQCFEGLQARHLVCFPPLGSLKPCPR